MSELGVYKPHSKYEAAFDPERCKASVPEGGRSGRFHQCLRKPVKDGWCWQHHPDTVEERREKSRQRFEHEMKRIMAPYRQAERLQLELAEVTARAARLRARIDKIERNGFHFCQARDGSPVDYAEPLCSMCRPGQEWRRLRAERDAAVAENEAQSIALAHYEADFAKLQQVAEAARDFCFTYQAAAQQLGNMEATPEMVDMLKAFHGVQAALTAHDAAGDDEGSKQ